MSDTFHHGSRRKELLFGRNWDWMRYEPSWFTRMYKHRARRTELRYALYRFLGGDEDIVWPLDRKPREYYW